MILSMVIKELGCQTRSRLTEKLAKVRKMCMHHTSYMATPEEKQIDTDFENGMTNVFLRESSGD